MYDVVCFQCIKEESEHAHVQENNLLWKLFRYPRVSNIRNRGRETYQWLRKSHHTSIRKSLNKTPTNALPKSVINHQNHNHAESSTAYVVPSSSLLCCSCHVWLGLECLLVAGDGFGLVSGEIIYRSLCWLNSMRRMRTGNGSTIDATEDLKFGLSLIKSRWLSGKRSPWWTSTRESPRGIEILEQRRPGSVCFC